MSRPLARVAVPGTSANLGPGFDALAVALDLVLVASVAPFGGQRVVPRGEGSAELPTDERNRVWQAFVRGCEAAGVDPPDVTITVDNPLPLERGLGSSAAAAVAGLVLARAVTAAALPDQRLLAIASELEGHPDNAAAALWGGLVLCDGPRTRVFPPSARLRPLVAVPRERSNTDEARGLLSDRVAHAEAAANGARVAGVLAGLGGWAPLEPETMTDVLHEPPRMAAMPASGALLSAARSAGFPAALSGAGPSVLVVAEAADAGALPRLRALAGDAFAVHALRWDVAGARLVGGARFRSGTKV